MRLYEKVHNTNWDTLIFLDACRYDFFKEFYSVYPNVEKGNISKVTSPGSATFETVQELFDKNRDWFLYSAHHYLGECSEPLPAVNTNDDDWHANDYFTEAKRVETKKDGVVGPKAFGKKILQNIDKINNNKTIIWFMQPHQPYVGTVRASFGEFFPWDIFMEDGEVNDSMQKLVKIAYKFNLLAALYSVSNIVGKLDGKTVITSDHGELLFDEDKTPDGFGHPLNSDNKKLIEIPWLEINSNKAINPLKLSNKDYVKLAYNSVLNRSPQQKALTEYTKHLNSNRDKVTRQTLLLILLHSDEYRETFKNPNKICGLDNYNLKSGDKNKTEVNLENKPKEILDALGYK